MTSQRAAQPGFLPSPEPSSPIPAMLPTSPRSRRWFATAKPRWSSRQPHPVFPGHSPVLSSGSGADRPISALEGGWPSSALVLPTADGGDADQGSAPLVPGDRRGVFAPWQGDPGVAAVDTVAVTVGETRTKVVGVQSSSSTQTIRPRLTSSLLPGPAGPRSRGTDNSISKKPKT